jgi:hypothetical protein
MLVFVSVTDNINMAALLYTIVRQKYQNQFM